MFKWTIGISYNFTLISVVIDDDDAIISVAIIRIIIIIIITEKWENKNILCMYIENSLYCKHLLI